MGYKIAPAFQFSVLPRKDDSDPAVVSSSAGQHTDVKQWAETTRDFP